MCCNFKKLFTNIHQLWRVATAMNAEQRELKRPLHLTCVHTLPRNVMIDKIVTKYCNFTQISVKKTRALIQKNYLPQINWWR